jgi:hypothetical protein
MKRLPLTPELIAAIKVAVGEDVDVNDGFAVFESISLNTLPLPGKDGTIFERARVSLLTLKQMVDSINGGNHLPLIHGHDLSSIPVGRVFKAALSLDATGSAELRTLWYIDPTEAKLAQKVDAGSLDEVSVQFLASQILCSECDFDYRDPETATWAHFRDRTCTNGHTIGTDGVHVRLVGLQVFTELSLVTRGAADKPKIVGKSQSKVAASLQALAAKGFEVDELYVTASRGEVQVDLTAVLAQLTEQTTAAATATAQLTAVTAERDTARTELATAQARVTELEAAAANSNAAELETATASLAEARTVLADIYTRLATAAGETDVTAPEAIAELKAGIEAHQSKLTAILPVGGAAASTQTNDAQSGAKFNASAASAFVVTR